MLFKSVGLELDFSAALILLDCGKKGEQMIWGPFDTVEMGRGQYQISSAKISCFSVRGRGSSPEGKHFSRESSRNKGKVWERFIYSS